MLVCFLQSPLPVVSLLSGNAYWMKKAVKGHTLEFEFRTYANDGWLVQSNIFMVCFLFFNARMNEGKYYHFSTI